MKKYIFGAVALLAGLNFAACTSDMNYKDAQVTAVKSLYEPADNKSVALQTSSTAALFFAWEACRVEDSGAPMYEVVFFKPGESEPIYKIAADNNGAINHATIAHKDMNKICKAAGFSQGNSGSVEWTILSSRGLNEALSTTRYKLNLTSIEGLEEIPAALFLTGEGTEAGADVTKALSFQSPEQGVFEIFTRLSAGKNYHFVSAQQADASSYYLNGDKVVEGEGSSKVDKDGVYRLVLDLNVVSVRLFKEITAMEMYFCPRNAKEMVLPYIGNGVFQGSGKIEFKQESWGRDERYKFIMTYADGKEQYWGTVNAGIDSRPGDKGPDDEYFYMMERDPNQWNEKWKFNTISDIGREGQENNVTKITCYFNKPQYTHWVEVIQ